MALPKRRFSRARRDKRRTQIHLTAPNIGRCSHCGASVMSHRVCPACGHYRGRKILSVKADAKKG